VVEANAAVQDSLVVHLRTDSKVRHPLTLRAASGRLGMDDALRNDLIRELRHHRSPRHVPDAIYEVKVIPRTLTGKKLEVPVKNLMLGADAQSVAQADTLNDPNALDAFVEIARSRRETEP